jgi:hypothetical protein
LSFGSAEEVYKAGTQQILAMRYNVYVDAAATFIAALYANLLGGAPLGEAATSREKSYQPIENEKSAFIRR